MRDSMDNFANIIARRVVVTFATQLQEPVDAKKGTFWLIVHKCVRKTAVIVAAGKKMELALRV